MKPLHEVSNNIATPLREEYAICTESNVRPDLLQQYAGEVLLRTLMTPHTDKARCVHGQSTLYDAVQVDATRARLAEAASLPIDGYDKVRIAEALRLSGIVNEAMKFVQPVKGTCTSAVAPERLLGKQETNCFGYTLVPSLCLETVGIRHAIGAMNGHAFVLMPTGNGTASSMWMIDSLVPRLSQPLDGPLVYNTAWGDVHRQLDLHERSGVYLNTKVIAERLGTTIVALAGEYNWLSRKSSLEQRKSLARGNEPVSMADKHTKLVLNILPMEEGRKALVGAAELEVALMNRDAAGALPPLLATKGLYLDVDVRNKHAEIRFIVRSLSQQGNLVGAQAAIDAYFASFRISEHPRIAEVEGDCLRIVAEADPKLLPQAHDRYAEARRRSQFGGYVRSVLAPKMALTGTAASTIFPGSV